jgi:hypothetical protein
VAGRSEPGSLMGYRVLIDATHPLVQVVDTVMVIAHE